MREALGGNAPDDRGNRRHRVADREVPQELRRDRAGGQAPEHPAKRDQRDADDDDHRRPDGRREVAAAEPTGGRPDHKQEPEPDFEGAVCSDDRVGRNRRPSC